MPVETFQLAVHIQIVEQKRSVGLQHPRHLAECHEILALVLEVSEAGEEADQPLKTPVAEGKSSHVRTGHRHGAVLDSSGPKKRERQIASHGLIASLEELRGMPSISAGQIQNAAAFQRKAIAEKVDLSSRLFLITIGIELEVLLAEPFLIPSHAAAQPTRERGDAVTRGRP